MERKESPTKKKKTENLIPETERKLVEKEVNQTVKKYKTDCMQHDPLLMVEWNSVGLAYRLNLNNANTKASIVNMLNTYGQLVQSSDSLWRFATSNDLTTALHTIRTTLVWTGRITGQSDIAKCFMIQADKKNSFVVTEMQHFNI